jgi:hypothetical protein
MIHHKTLRGNETLVSDLDPEGLDEDRRWEGLSGQ